MKKKVFLVVIISLTVAFQVYFWHGMVSSLLYNPHQFVGYKVESTLCKTKPDVTTCTITLSIHNGSKKAVAPDFTGTDGPGFTETGVWGAYLIDSKGNKSEVRVERDVYGIFINPSTTVTAPINVNLAPGTIPAKLILFDINFTLDPKVSE